MIDKPLFGKPTLKLGRGDQTKLVAGLAKQVEVVRAAVADIGINVPVRGAFCFVDSELPLLGTRPPSTATPSSGAAAAPRSSTLPAG